MNFINRNISRIILPLSGIIMLTACDNIDIADRYEPVEKPVVSKVMLITEFTGNMCTNCPQGAGAIHNIQESFPGQVIAVGLHPAGGGPNTTPIGDQDFRCEEAQVFYEQYKPSGFPCAVFNGETTSTRFALWYSIVYDAFSSEENQNARVSLDAVTSYDPTTRNLTVDYTLVPSYNIDENLSVLVWIMENDIVGYQLDGGVMLDNYVHNHVLRASLNGDWGTPLPDQLKDGETYTGTASMTLSDKWVADNCQVVVFAFRSDSKIVEQAFETDVVE